MAKSLQELTAEVHATTDAVDAANVALVGFIDRMQAALDAAIAAGVDPAALQALTDEIAAQRSHVDALAAAIPANT